MRFLVDAQLPRRFAHRLREAGHDTVHTLDLPEVNRTTDRDIARLADESGRVVVTKDADFMTSHLLRGEPARLWVVSTGNLSNAELETLVMPRLALCTEALQTCAFVELRRDALVLHR